MGVFSTESEYVSPVAPARLYKALALDSDNIFPKALPNFIKSSETIEGDGGPGSIKKITFADGGYVKDLVDAIDAENFVYHYSAIEGTGLTESDPLVKISFEYKFVAKADGGTIIKSTSKFYTKGDEKLTEEFLKAGKAKSAGFIKGVEDYLLANPAYN